MRAFNNVEVKLKESEREVRIALEPQTEFMFWEVIPYSSFAVVLVKVYLGNQNRVISQARFDTLIC